MVFVILSITQPRADFPEMKNKWGESYPHPSLLPWESFQTTVQGGEIQAETSGFPELQRWKRDCKETKVARVTGKRARKERASHTGDMQSIGLEYSAEYWLVHACEESTWDQGKNYSKELERTVWHTKGARNNACSH